ncbi:MAG: FAD-dependent oxidoreductase, partial [Actinomycetota bacterium]
MGSASPPRPGLPSRADALDRLGSERFDLLVVGGGITGAGVALDAATRGLRVALIEARDYAAGTSSRSSKLVHGGLRYLQQGELGLVRQSAREREVLRRLAPHLVYPLPFVLPADTAGVLTRTGLRTYDLLARVPRGLRHREVGRRTAAAMTGGIEARAGAFVYHDCATDDARLTLEVLHAAAAIGAVACNHVRAVALCGVGGRAAGCEATDALSGRGLTIRATDVVNAAGVWADEVRALEDPGAGPALRPSKGIHLVLPRSLLDPAAAALVPAPAGRRIFAIPWRSRVLVGPTDADYGDALDAPAAAAEEVDELLVSLSRAYGRPFDRASVVSAFAGLRPLVAAPGTAATTDLSRRHVLTTGPSGMVTLTGGKLTTYRHMAQEAVDLLASRRGYGPSVTARTPLQGDGGVRAALEARTAELGLPGSVAASLLLSYGDRAPAVLALAEEEDLADPLVAGLPYLRAELVWGARREQAATVGDLLARRTRLALEDRDGGLGGKATPALLASVLGISAQEAAAQVAAYRSALAHERGPALARP